MSSILAWGKLIHDYERASAEKVPDPIKVAVLTPHLPDQRLRDHILLNAARLKSYESARNELQDIMAAQRVWQPPAASSDVVPMDLDAMTKGRKAWKERQG